MRSTPCLSVSFYLVVVTFFFVNMFWIHLFASCPDCAEIVLVFARLFFRRGHRHNDRAGLFHRPLGVRLQQPEITHHHF